MRVHIKPKTDEAKKQQQQQQQQQVVTPAPVAATPPTPVVQATPPPQQNIVRKKLFRCQVCISPIQHSKFIYLLFTLIKTFCLFSNSHYWF